MLLGEFLTKYLHILSVANVDRRHHHGGDDENCIVINHYPFVGEINRTGSIGHVQEQQQPIDFDDKFYVLSQSLKREKREIFDISLGSDKEDFLHRHYIPMNETAAGGKGGPGTDWTEVMTKRHLNIPSRRHVGKHTFVNFNAHSPRWDYIEQCCHLREIVQTTEPFQTWELNYNHEEEKWIEQFCAFTPIDIALD